MGFSTVEICGWRRDGVGMDRLKNRRDFIPNGFWIITPAISSDPFGDLGWDFDTLVREEIGRRHKNPRLNLAMDWNTVANEVDAQCAARCRKIRGGDIYLAADSQPGGPFPNLAAPRKANWRDVAGGVKSVAAGVGVLLDWLGSGAQPVASSVAELRASVCPDCPKNQPGDILAIFTQPVADKIRQQLAIRKNLNLTTTQDAKLHICGACHCPLQLKVHVPISHVEEHLDDGTRAKLDPRCWILKETEHQQTRME